MKLPNVSLPDQPQLQAVLNRMVAAINSVSGSDIVAGRGIAITDSAGQQIIEASPEAVWQTRGLYPRILKNEGSAAVGLTPGFVTFLRDNTTSVSVVPYIGTDFATGTLIDDAAPPSEILTDETYYTRLKLEGGHTVKVDFVEASATPAKDAEYLIVNKFTLTTITGGDQVISGVEVYSQEPIVPSQNSQWFRVFDVTTSAPTFKVRVAAGRISAPDLSYVTNDPPTAVTLLDSYTVAETADLTVSDGSYVLLRIPLSTSKSYNKTLTGTGASITLNNYVLTYNAATGADVVVASSVTAPSSTYSYIVLAQISASDSGITIKQKHDGIVTVPAVTLPYPSALSVTGSNSEDYWTTEYVSSGTANVKRGALITFTYYLADPTESRVSQNLQLEWGTTGAAGVEEDIEVSGLANGDYLWVEIELLPNDTDFATGAQSAGDPHTHQVYSSFNEVQGGANIPFINFGDYATMTTMTVGTIKIPFAQYVTGSIVQLHRGVMICPPFFSLASP